MTKKLLALCSICIAMHTMAQSLFPSVYQRPATGFEKIRNENPYIIRQQKVNDSTWVNAQRFSWAPGPFEESRVANGIYTWTNNNWQVLRLTTNAFTLNGDNLPITAVQQDELNFGSSNQQNKYRYTFTYYSNKKLSSLTRERATDFNGNNYQLDEFTAYYYNLDGTRKSDSSYYAEIDKKTVVYYTYNGNKQITGSVLLDAVTGDSLSKSSYQYQAGNLTIAHQSSFNTNTDQWETTDADTLTYTNNKVSNRVVYGFSSINGGSFMFQPIQNETYQYYPDGTISIIDAKSWQNGNWANFYLYSILYDGKGKPSIAFRKSAINATTYEAVASSRYLFEILSGLQNETLNTLPIEVYPNPATTQINIGLSGNHINGKVRITDLLGQQVHTSLVNDNQELVVDVSTLKNGIYLVFLETGEGTSVCKKIIVSH